MKYIYLITLLFVYNSISSIDYYRPTISSQTSDNKNVDDEEGHDHNEHGSRVPLPSNPSTKHGKHRLKK